MAATDLQISENSFLVKYFDMVNAKLHLVWGHFQHGNPAMPVVCENIFSMIENRGLRLDFKIYLRLLYKFKKETHSVQLRVLTKAVHI